MILIIGVLAVSTAAIFVRLAMNTAGVRGVGFSMVLAASRLTIAALVLLPAWRKIRKAPPSAPALIYAGASGVMLALHFATWIASLSYTSIAASTTLVATNPVWIALLSWLWFGEKPTLLTASGIAIALTGGIIVGFGDAGIIGDSNNPLLGDSLALVGALAVSVYFLLGREAQRRGLGIGGYVTIAYSVAAAILLPLPFVFGASYTGYPNAAYIYILLMALLPQLLGHTCCSWAVCWISPTLVSLAILFEPVGSSFLGYLVFGEVPGNQVLAGAVVLLAGVAIAAVASRE